MVYIVNLMVEMVEVGARYVIFVLRVMFLAATTTILTTGSTIQTIYYDLHIFHKKKILFWKKLYIYNLHVLNWLYIKIQVIWIVLTYASSQIIMKKLWISTTTTTVNSSFKWPLKITIMHELENNPNYLNSLFTDNQIYIYIYI